MSHPSQGPMLDPYEHPELWSHPKLPVVRAVAVKGVCTKCGLIHTRCVDHRRVDGQPCGKAAPAPLTTCFTHGGTRSVHEEHVHMKAAIEACNMLGLPVEIDPMDALYKELCRTEGHVQWLLGELQKLDAKAMTWGLHEHRKGEGPEGPVDVETFRAAAPVIYELYTRERAHLVRVSAECVKAGVSVAMAQLARDAGQRDAELIAAVIEALGVDMQAPETRQAVERAFTVVDGGKAA